MPINLRRAKILQLPGVVHGFTDREGGHSSAAFATLNLSTSVEDERDNVLRNRQAVLTALGRSDAAWVSLRQVHGEQIVEVTRQAGRSIEADAVWTRDPGAVLCVLVADCVPILFADEDGHAVGAAHAGWRGTRLRIAQKMVDRLVKAVGAVSKLRVAIGPAVGPCCYQIGADVGAELTQAIPNAEDAVRETAPGRLVADLWALNRQVLLEAGVLPDAIEVLRHCTFCEPCFFSHRRDQGRTGRQAGVIGLVPR